MKRKKKKNKYVCWREDEIQYLLENYEKSELSVAEMAVQLNRSYRSITHKANSLNLKRPPEVFVKAGKALCVHPNSIKTRWYPGMVSPKLGMKMSEQQYEKCKKTMFKKGQKPQNYQKVGTERLNKDGYIAVKVADPDVWKLKHRLVWEQHNGPIPKGHNIQFKDKNTKNCDITNLYIISRHDQLTNENSIYRYPNELRELMMLRGTLKRRIKEQPKNKLNND